MFTPRLFLIAAFSSLLAACGAAADRPPAPGHAPAAHPPNGMAATVRHGLRHRQPSAKLSPLETDGPLRILRAVADDKTAIAVWTDGGGLESRRLRVDGPVRIGPLDGDGEMFVPLGGVIDLTFGPEPVRIDGPCDVTRGDVRCRFRQPAYDVPPGETVRAGVSVELPGDQPAQLRVRFEASPDGFEVHPQEVPWSPLYGPTDLPVRVTAPASPAPPSGRLTATILAGNRPVARVSTRLHVNRTPDAIVR
jgi:hypothetical protein